MEEVTGRLSELSVGEGCVVRELYQRGNARRRLMDLGVNIGGKIVCVGISPLGNPKAYSVRGVIIAIRNNDADDIVVTKE